MTRPSLSVIVPVFNEQEIIEGAILKNLRILNESGLVFEMVVVNDGSSDSSATIIDKVTNGTDRVSVYHHIKNVGLGGAMRTGIQHSRMDYITVMPADSPLTEKLLHGFYDHMSSATVVVAYRRERRGYSTRMKVNSGAFHLLVSLLFNMRLKDYNWIHLYPRTLFMDGNVIITYSGLFALAEILIKAKWARYRFEEFEVEQQERLTGIASASQLINVIKTLRDLIHFRIVSLLQESGA